MKTFLEELAERIPIERVILFGSRAGDEYLEGSDVDLIVVSPAFEDVPWPDRAADLYLLWDAPIDPEFLCYTPREFERKRDEIGIVRSAVAEGSEVPLPA